MNTSSPSARLRPFRPQPFGRYTLLSHLATGGMGEIYLARLEGAQGFEKLCVIKKILPQLAEDKEFVERFVGEARTLVKLHHGSIAQVLDMGLHEGEAYMALEYVDGKDLRKVAGRVRDRQMPLPLTFVLFVMGRVLDALAYAHRKRDDDEKEINLVHRDISPQNILISYEGEVKVIDFGLAKSRLSAAKTNPSIILGKFLYMSPEQAKHQQVDRRSDLYAVGLCLYELISGKNPFDSVHSGELMSAVANPRIAPLNQVEPFTPPQVAQLVMKALAVEPAQRFQTAEEFRGRLMSVLMEIDPSSGPESVSRFMRDLFSAEFQSERKLLAQLKEVQRMGELPPRSELDTDPGARVSPPSPPATLPPKTIKLDPPSQPLSFQPTPRSRQGGSVHEAETRPAVSFDALDAAARARVRPAVPTSSPTTDTVTVEIPIEPRERPPSPPVAAAAPPPSRSNAPTLELPIPYVPAAAIPPAAGSPAPAGGAARTLEAPRVTVPPPPPASAPAPKPMELSRAAMPPPPSGSAPPPRPGEPQRVAVPPPPPAGAQAPRAAEPQRAPTAPPPPASAHAQEPRSPELARSQAPTIQSPAVFGASESSAPAAAASPSLLTPPAPMAAVREPSLPPVPEETLPPHATAESSGASRESPRGSTARASQGEPGGSSSRPTEPLLALTAEDMVSPVDMSRRGLDDTHPSYQMASGKPPEDTQPRVVLDDPSLGGQQEDEEQIIVSGVLEEPTPARGKAVRRTRASSTGMPSVARVPGSSGKFAARPAEPEAPESQSAEEDDSAPVRIDIEDGGEAAREPREGTRKASPPTRPGEGSRRAQREDSRRPAAPAPARKRSWAWLIVSVLMLGVAGGAVFKTLPQLQHLLNFGQAEVTKPPPPMPIRPVPVPSGPPGAPHSAPAAVAGASAPGAAAAAPGSTPAAREGAPAGAATASAPGANSEAAIPDDDLFVPLPTSPSAPKKAPSGKSTKKSARASKELTEFQRDWKVTRELYGRFTQEQACEATRIAIFCTRYNDLKQQVAEQGDEYSKDLHNQVKKLKKEFQQRSP